MNVKILDEYSKSIKELEQATNTIAKIDPNRSYINISEDVVTIRFYSNCNTNLHLPQLNTNIEGVFTKEDEKEVLNFLFEFMTKKYNKNHEDAKKAFQQMLIEKL